MVTWIIGIASIIMVFGGLMYLREMFLGQVKPNQVTWLLWGLAPLIGALAAWQDGVGWRVWLPIMCIGLGTILVVILSFFTKNGYWHLGWFDYVCALFALLTLLLWALTQDPFIAIVLALVSDGLAALPTVRKSWKFPETEAAAAYFFTAIASATGLLALERGDFVEWAFPTYVAMINFLIAGVIYFRRRVKQV